MSPEVLLCNKYSTKGDVWTFGIVLVEILTYGKEPYEGEKLQLFCSGTGNKNRAPLFYTSFLFPKEITVNKD